LLVSGVLLIFSPNNDDYYAVVLMSCFLLLVTWIALFNFLLAYNSRVNLIRGIHINVIPSNASFDLASNCLASSSILLPASCKLWYLDLWVLHRRCDSESLFSINPEAALRQTIIQIAMSTIFLRATAVDRWWWSDQTADGSWLEPFLMVSNVRLHIYRVYTWERPTLSPGCTVSPESEESGGRHHRGDVNGTQCHSV
jgi:hypothetical protein